MSTPKKPPEASAHGTFSNPANGAAPTPKKRITPPAAGSFGAFNAAAPSPFGTFGAVPELPPPGSYQGVIADVTLSTRDPLTAWLGLKVVLIDTTAQPERVNVCIATAEGSPHRGRETEGIRLVNRIATATLLDISEVKTLEDIPRFLLGEAITATVAHRVKDGVTDLIIRDYSAPDPSNPHIPKG